jgi:hypothetical protein
MKNIFLFLLFTFALLCRAQQTYPLRTYTNIPENSYLKDTNNELQSYEGTWKGTWNNKIIFITFKKITNKYNPNLKYFKDLLIAKFVVKDNNGNILFDNTNLSDNSAKIKGFGFIKNTSKYLINYQDPDLCHMTGSGRINFTDATKTKLEWKYSQDTEWIENECFYHGLPESQRPEPLPMNIILTKQ